MRAHDPAPPFCDGCESFIRTDDTDRLTISTTDQTFRLCGSCAAIVRIVLEDMRLLPKLSN